MEKYVEVVSKMSSDIWRTTGASDELLAILGIAYQSHQCWKNCDKSTWLIYISALYEREKIDKAKEVLDKYILYYGYLDIHKYVLVSKLATEVGVDSPEIKKTAYLYSKMKNNLQDRVFEKIVSDKSVVVVGNGDSELNSGNGEEIDSYDVVIRFNNYPLNCSKDYGIKTDIWVRCGNVSVEDRSATGDYELVVWEPDFEHMPIDDTQIAIIFRDIQHNIPVIFLDYAIKNDCRNESQLNKPTTGCLLLHYLYKDRKYRDISVRAFSFVNDSENLGHFYDNLSRMTSDHDVSVEFSYLRGLCFGETREPFSTNDRDASHLKEVINIKQNLRYRVCGIYIFFMWNKVKYEGEYMIRKVLHAGRTTTVWIGTKNHSRYRMMNSQDCSFQLCYISGDVIVPCSDVVTPCLHMSFAKKVLIRMANIVRKLIK